MGFTETENVFATIPEIFSVVNTVKYVNVRTMEYVSVLPILLKDMRANVLDS